MLNELLVSIGRARSLLSLLCSSIQCLIAAFKRTNVGKNCGKRRLYVHPMDRSWANGMSDAYGTAAPFVISEKSHEVAKRHGLWPVSFSDFQCHFESRGREEEACLGGK